MSPVGISSKRNYDIGVAFPISLEYPVVRRQFVALVSPFQGDVACRNLALTGPHYYNYLGSLCIGGERVFFMLSNLRDVTQPSGLSRVQRSVLLDFF